LVARICFVKYYTLMVLVKSIDDLYLSTNPALSAQRWPSPGRRDFLGKAGNIWRRLMWMAWLESLWLIPPQTPLRSSAILSHDYRFKNLRKLGNRIMITAKRLNICKPTISNVSRAKIPHDACNFSVVLGEAFTQDSEDWQPECF